MLVLNGTDDPKQNSSWIKMMRAWFYRFIHQFLDISNFKREGVLDILKPFNQICIHTINKLFNQPSFQT